MISLRHLTIVFSSVLAIIMAGCATNTSEITVNTSNFTITEKPQTIKTVFIKNIVDERVFKLDSDDPSVPSVQTSTDEERDHVIGRKRNAYGMAMGKIVLTPEQTVRGLTRQAITQALVENGYKVISEEKNITKDTVIMDVTINKFWAWMNPGFFYLTLSSNIEANVNVQKSMDSSHNVEIKGSHKEGFQMATDDNWLIAIQTSFENFYKNALKAFSSEM